MEQVTASSSSVIPILDVLLPEGVKYGSVILVEFGPDSVWYEASLSIAAGAVRRGVKTQYHTFQHDPAAVREALGQLGLDVKKLEDGKSLTIQDSYSPQVDLKSKSMKLMDFSRGVEEAQRLRAGVIPEERRRALHIDDDTSIFLQYNPEKDMIDQWRTRGIPSWKMGETIALNSLLTGVASDSFYRRFESMCDGIVDFKSEERNGKFEHFVRIRRVSRRPVDSTWRKLLLLDNGEVQLVG